MSAGATMPPTAANAGSSALRSFDSSPTYTLAFELQADEQEEDRHQRVVDPVLERSAGPSFTCQKSQPGSATGELASASDTMVQPSSRTPPNCSDFTKRLKVAVSFMAVGQ